MSQIYTHLVQHRGCFFWQLALLVKLSARTQRSCRFVLVLVCSMSCLQLPGLPVTVRLDPLNERRQPFRHGHACLHPCYHEGLSITTHTKHPCEAVPHIREGPALRSRQHQSISLPYSYGGPGLAREPQVEAEEREHWLSASSRKYILHTNTRHTNTLLCQRSTFWFG